MKRAGYEWERAPVRRRIRRRLPLLLALAVFAGMFARITVLAQLSERSKQISALEAELSRMEKELSGKELLLSELHDLRRIALRAAELGMTSPEEHQIRVLHFEAPDAGDTSAKTQP